MYALSSVNIKRNMRIYKIKWKMLRRHVRQHECFGNYFRFTSNIFGLRYNPVDRLHIRVILSACNFHLINEHLKANRSDVVNSLPV